MSNKVKALKERIVQLEILLDNAAKADWNNAPDWANYYAIDEDGSRYWYALKPTSDDIFLNDVLIKDTWIPSSSSSKCAEVQRPYHDWKNSLEERPDIDKEDLLK